MQGTKTGKYLYNELKTVLEHRSILFENNIGILTDVSRPLSSMKVGVSERPFQDIKKVTGRETFVNNCLIQQASLCAKILSLPNATEPIIKLIDFIKSRVLNHREFKEFLKDLGTVHIWRCGF